MVNQSQLGQVANPFKDQRRRSAHGYASNQALTQAVQPTGQITPTNPLPVTPMPRTLPQAPAAPLSPQQTARITGTPATPSATEGMSRGQKPTDARRRTTAPPVAPAGPVPSGGPETGSPGGAAGSNQFGNTANLDPQYLTEQIRAAFAAAGKTPTDQDIAYWVKKASTPDIYSDGQVRVGWNPYWADRIRTGSDSSDPRLAGTEGVISNPGAYGYGTFTGTDGGMYFTREGQTRTAPAAAPAVASTPGASNQAMSNIFTPWGTATLGDTDIHAVIADIMAQLAGGVSGGR